jgi:hypothetical protein
MQGRETAESHDVEAKNFSDATGVLLDWLREHAGEHGAGYGDVALAAVRVVHGGERFAKPAVVDASVEREIEALQRFAPLHNARSLEVIRALRKHAPEMKIAAGFDTSFYRRMPEVAWRYPLPPELADKYGIRRWIPRLLASLTAGALRARNEAAARRNTAGVTASGERLLGDGNSRWPCGGQLDGADSFGRIDDGDAQRERGSGDCASAGGAGGHGCRGRS